MKEYLLSNLSFKYYNRYRANALMNFSHHNDIIIINFELLHEECLYYHHKNCVQYG